jgi:hypothetical protein
MHLRYECNFYYNRIIKRICRCFFKKMIRLINTRKMERIKVKGICSYTNPQRQRLNYCHTMMHITIKTAHEISFNAFLSTLTLEAT